MCEAWAKHNPTGVFFRFCFWVEGLYGAETLDEGCFEIVPSEPVVAIIGSKLHLQDFPRNGGLLSEIAHSVRHPAINIYSHWRFFDCSQGAIIYRDRMR